MGARALVDMVTKYLPESASAYAPSDRMARRLAGRLIRLLPSVVPLDAAPAMSRLGGAELVGAMCHWLGVRLLRMPWVEVLRQMPLQELREFARRSGVKLQVNKKTRPFLERRRIVASLASSASLDHRRWERLLRELTTDGAAAPPVASVGFLDECPRRVQLAVGAWHRAR